MKIRNEKKIAQTIFIMAMCIFLYDENNSRGDRIQAEWESAGGGVS